jgi:hypothetical protein
MAQKACPELQLVEKEQPWHPVAVPRHHCKQEIGFMQPKRKK